MNKRRIRLAFKLLSGFRPNKDFVKYVVNRVRVACFNPHKEVRVNYPTGLMLELGNRCNLHCIICPREYKYGKQMDQGFMSLENVYKIVDEVYPYLDSIGLTGLGETLLYPHLEEVVKYIKSKRKNLVISMSTNANFSGCVEKIAPLLPYLDSVQFSVDGVGSTYETIRPNTRFETIAENIKRIVSASDGNTEFVINTVITPENYDNIIPVIDFAQSVGIKFVNFNRINLASIPERDFEEHNKFFHSEEYRSVLKEFRERQKTMKGITFSEETDGNGGSFQDCTFPWYHQYITWDGYMVPCCAKPFPKEKNFGNVFEKGVMGVLNGDEFLEWRRLWQKNVTPGFCKHCNNIRL